MLLFALGAGDLPQRVAFDGLRTSDKQWDLDEGMTVQVEPGSGITLRLHGVLAAAAPVDRVPYDESARVTLKFDPEQTSSDLTVQVEWIDASGQLIEAVKALEGAQATKGLDSRVVTDFLPASGLGHDRIKKFRLKLWLRGENEKKRSASITNFRITTDRRWRAKGDVKLVHTYDGSSKIEPDKGIAAKPQSSDAGAPILFTIDPGTPFSAATLTHRAAYDPAGVVMLDIGQMRGSVTLQALCWSESGEFLKAVDLMKDVLETGTYETPFTAYAKQIPPATKQVSFKLWLGGKQEPYAWLQGIFYGVAGPAK